MKDYTTDVEHLDALWEIWDPLVEGNLLQHTGIATALGREETANLGYDDRMCVREAMIMEKWDRDHELDPTGLHLIEADERRIISSKRI